MTLAQLRYAITVANSNSMNEDARTLFISQPSLSSAIKELEHHGYVQRNIVRNEYGLFTDKFNIGLSGTINNVPAVV